MIIKIVSIARIENIQEGKTPSILQVPFIPKNNNGDDDDNDHISV